jgi:hypothetical protein
MDPTTTFVIGAGFGAVLGLISAWAYGRARQAHDYAVVQAIARHAGAAAAREAIARQLPPRDRSPTAVLKPPMEDRPTIATSSRPFEHPVADLRAPREPGKGPTKRGP